MSDMPDLSSLFEVLNNKNIDLNNLMQNFSNSSNSNTNETSNTSSPNFSDFFKTNDSSNNTSNSNSNHSDNNFQMPDIETMMKIMKIINSLNSTRPNPSANLLYSLKPFLRDSKKEKIDQYIKFLKISSIISEINKSGGDFE